MRLNGAVKNICLAVLSNSLWVLLVYFISPVIPHVPPDVALSVGLTFSFTASGFIFWHSWRRKFGVGFKTQHGEVRGGESAGISLADNLGVTGMWRDELDFEASVGKCYRDYCLERIKETPDGQEVKILGYDWIELLSDTRPLGPHVYSEGNKSRLKFRVILVDPESIVPIEKRAWEMFWKDESRVPFYPEGTNDQSMDKLRMKIKGCLNNAQIFERGRPRSFEVKLTQTFPCFSMLMTDDRVIGGFYSLPYKGKDVVLFEAKRLSGRKARDLSSRPDKIQLKYGRDLYGFLRGYFDAVWAHPEWRTCQLKRRSEATIKSKRKR